MKLKFEMKVDLNVLTAKLRDKIANSNTEGKNKEIGWKYLHREKNNDVLVVSLQTEPTWYSYGEFVEIIFDNEKYLDRTYILIESMSRHVVIFGKRMNRNNERLLARMLKEIEQKLK